MPNFVFVDMCGRPHVVSMRLTIRARGFDLPPALGEYATRRAHFALSRFAPRLGHVHVRLSDVNGPRGGNDKRCLIVIIVRGARAVTIDDVQADMYAAIDNALGRAAQSVARLLDSASAAG